MSLVEKLNIGIVGAAGRGASFRAAFDAHPLTHIHAVCDVRQDALEETARVLGAEETYTDYDEMLAKSDIDAVVIGTPMQFHAPQAIAALERNIHVLSEVTAEFRRGMSRAGRRTKSLGSVYDGRKLHPCQADRAGQRVGAARVVARSTTLKVNTFTNSVS